MDKVTPQVKEITQDKVKPKVDKNMLEQLEAGKKDKLLTGQIVRK